MEGFEAVSFAAFTCLLDEVVNLLAEVVDIVEDMGIKAKFDAITDAPLVEMLSTSHHGAEKTNARCWHKAFLRILTPCSHQCTFAGHM